MAQDNILQVYLSTVIPVLACCPCTVCQAISDQLSHVIEGVQTRALRITYPEAKSYTEALQLANKPSLKKAGRDDICVKYMDKMKSKDHPLQFLLPRPLFNQPEYNLRKSANRFYLFIESIKEGR